MKKKYGFISLVMLSIILALSTATVWWWHAVDLTVRLVYEKKRYHEARYCAEFCLYQCAYYIAQQIDDYFTHAQQAPIVQQGSFSWSQAEKRQVVSFSSTVQHLADNELLLTITVNNKGCQATMKGVLHATDTGQPTTTIIVDHLTLCSHV